MSLDPPATKLSTPDSGVKASKLVSTPSSAPRLTLDPIGAGKGTSPSGFGANPSPGNSNRRPPLPSPRLSPLALSKAPQKLTTNTVENLLRRAKPLEYEPAVFGADASRPLTPGYKEELQQQLKDIQEEDQGLREVFRGTTSFIPPLFCDPLTGHLLLEPVVAPDGYTYERANILQILGNQGETKFSPISKQPFLETLILHPNNALHHLITCFLDDLAADADE